MSTFGQRPLREGERAVAVRGELLVVLTQRFAACVVQLDDFSAHECAGAQREDDVGAALHERDALVLALVDRGHALALGVERHLADPTRTQVPGREPARHLEQRGLGRVADEPAVGVGASVVVRRGHLEQQREVAGMRGVLGRLDTPVVLDRDLVEADDRSPNSHLVSGERAGLVGADEGRRAERLDGVRRRTMAWCSAILRTPSESAMVTTAGSPSGIAATASETARSSEAVKPARNAGSRDGLGQRCRRCLKKTAAICSAKMSAAMARTMSAMRLPTRCKLALQGGGLVGLLGEQVGDLADFGVAPGAGDDHVSAADSDRGAGEHHPDTVAERGVRSPSRQRCSCEPARSRP